MYILGDSRTPLKVTCWQVRGSLSPCGQSKTQRRVAPCAVLCPVLHLGQKAGTPTTSPFTAVSVERTLEGKVKSRAWAGEGSPGTCPTGARCSGGAPLASAGCSSSGRRTAGTAPRAGPGAGALALHKTNTGPEDVRGALCRPRQLPPGPRGPVPQPHSISQPNPSNSRHLVC